jgi:hypothetical protein
LTEVHGGNLIITGGIGRYNNWVTMIDTRREFAVSYCSPMVSKRAGHDAVYHDQHLYVIGGCKGKVLKKCERYVCAENRWEALPSLSKACVYTSGVVVEKSLYALGGSNKEGPLDLIQKLNLERPSHWRILQFKLPFAGFGIPCFKLRNTEVYLVVGQTLCSFTKSKVYPLLELSGSIQRRYGACFFKTSNSPESIVFNGGTLYTSTITGVAVRIIFSLTY